MKAFSHCELDHFEDACVGCKGDGKGDCAAVFVDVRDPVPNWSWSWCWTSWLFGTAWCGAIRVIHIGPLAILRVKA